MLICHIFVGLPTILPKMKVVAIVYFSWTNFRKSLQSRRLSGDVWGLKLVTRLIRKKCVWVVFRSSLGLKYRQSNIGHPDLLPHAWWFLCPWLCFLPRTILAFRYLWLSRFPRLKQSVPAQICYRRLVCQACVPFSPLCLPYSPFVSSSVPLLLPVAAAWLGLLFCSKAESSWILLFWQECERVWLPKSLSGDLGGQSPKIWISDLVRISFGPRYNCSQSKRSPEKFCKGFVMVCCILLYGLLLLLLLLLVLLLLGKARFLGREPRDS